MITWFQKSNSRTALLHDTCGFMAENKWLSDFELANLSMAPVVDLSYRSRSEEMLEPRLQGMGGGDYCTYIRAAETSRAHRNGDLIFRWKCRYRACFVIKVALFA
jgi:hypothetical protein